MNLLEATACAPVTHMFITHILIFIAGFILGYILCRVINCRYEIDGILRGKDASRFNKLTEENSQKYGSGKQ